MCAARAAEATPEIKPRIEVEPVRPGAAAVRGDGDPRSAPGVDQRVHVRRREPWQVRRQQDELPRLATTVCKRELKGVIET